MIISLPARLIHWLSAFIIIVTFVLGVWMCEAASGPQQDQLFDLHRSFGSLVLALTALRLLWRLGRPPPPLPADTPGWMRLAANLSHGSLYVLLFAQPMLGWAGSNAFGVRVGVFGLFDLPSLVAKSEPLSDLLFEAHTILAYMLAAIVVAHIGAAFFHLIVRRDGVFNRMVG